jgi:SNF2 family DNA or RNA helicase
MCSTSLYSLHAARVNFVPHQFKPVLKLIRSDRPRLLIADEVGVGKTIEAGLILRELQARQDLNSVLIVCPKALVTERKWQLELKRFDEDFEHLNGSMLRQCITETDNEGAWPSKYARAIVPFSLFDSGLLYGEHAPQQKRRRSNIGLLNLDPPPRFDMVIVDEAHHLRNSDTFLHQGVRFFCEHAKTVLFLTATPIQLGSHDLFVLLNMLRPDLILDAHSFRAMAEPNPYINQAIERARNANDGWQVETLEALQQAGQTGWGTATLVSHPIFQQTLEQLAQPELSQEQRITCIRNMEQMHTFDTIINRTRRRDIGAFTIRRPETVTVEFTRPQGELHDTLLDTLSQMIAHTHGNISVKFLTSTIRRRASSCLFGLTPFLQEILQRELESLFEDMNEDGEAEPDWDVLLKFRDQVQHILEMVESLDPADPKIAALQKIVQDKQSMSNNKLLIFTSFKHTLSYMFEHLQYIPGVRIAAVHGGTPDEARRTLRHRFSLPQDDPDALDVLLSTEVGCEGLDYQFCDCLVNYDIPWNPMRIEQRIGRIDRYGQKSETVAIYNLVTPGTIDFDIYERCHLRIGVFHNVIGGSEEILGQLTQKLRAVAENLRLSEQERLQKLQQLADNEIRLLHEQQNLEDAQADLFGLTVPMQQATQDEVERATNFWLQSEQLRNLVEHYLHQRCGSKEHILGEKVQKTLRLAQEARNLLLEDYHQLPRQKSPVARTWEKWLKGHESRLAITFDAAWASENRDVMFITPVHPLAQQAARQFDSSQAAYTIFQVQDTQIAAGIYPFTIYQWQKRGIREDMIFQLVSTEPALMSQFMRLIEAAEPRPETHTSLPERSVFDALESTHAQLWSHARDEHREETQRLASYRLESLNRSYQAQQNVLHERLAQVNDERIQRLYRSQLANAEADFQRRVAEINDAVSKADILTQRVAFGVLVIEQPEEQ